jgi:3'-5' exoribonuclease 1
MRPIAENEAQQLHSVLLLDLEFTCWEGSLESRWSDPYRPAEVIEIGLAAYDIRKDLIVDTFSTLVRPQLNPILSDYCCDLLRITQQDIDPACNLEDALNQVSNWQEKLAVEDACTCSWGTIDRVFLEDDARRQRVTVPFVENRHVDLSLAFKSSLDFDSGREVDRDKVRSHFRLDSNRNRHRALPDALDLAQFLQLLRTRWLRCPSG